MHYSANFFYWKSGNEIILMRCFFSAFINNKCKLLYLQKNNFCAIRKGTKHFIQTRIVNHFLKTWCGTLLIFQTDMTDITDMTDMTDMTDAIFKDWNI